MHLGRLQRLPTSEWLSRQTPPLLCHWACKSENPASALLTETRLQVHPWWAWKLQKAFGVRADDASRLLTALQALWIVHPGKGLSTARRILINVWPRWWRLQEDAAARRRTNVLFPWTARSIREHTWLWKENGGGCSWNALLAFPACGKLEVFDFISFSTMLKFQTRTPFFPPKYCWGTSINLLGGIYVLLRDTMCRVQSDFHQRQSLNSSVLDLGMFPTSQIVCFNKYSSRLFKVIQNTSSDNQETPLGKKSKARLLAWITKLSNSK